MEEARRPNELLRRARLLRGWSQQRVADHINAPNRQLVYRWEAGKRSPGPFYRERLCQEFMRVVTPSGKVGFVMAEAINPLGSDQLCYGKDVTGTWKIVGMIGGE